MEKTCVRLPPEIARKLRSEAHKASESGGKTVTVSDLIRTCLEEKFRPASAPVRVEKGVLLALQDEVGALRDRSSDLDRDLGELIGSLAKIFPLLATREQVDSLTDAIATVIRTVKEKGA